MNHLKGREFISIFQIDGVPIIPPLITSEKRKMIQRYKDQAILVENNIILRKQASYLPISEQSIVEDSECTFDDDYLKISSFLESKVELKNNLNNITSPVQCLQKSDTLIYDVISNTVIIPYKSKSTEFSTSLNQLLQQNLYCDENTNTNWDLTESANSCNDQCKKYLSSVVVKPATPENDCKLSFSPNKETDISETQKVLSASTLFSEVDNTIVSTHSPLIRSNSFTLEKGSTFLIEHMNKLEVKDQHITQNNTNKKKLTSFSLHKSPKIAGYKKKSNQNLYDKTEIKKENMFTNTALFKNKKSPYELEVSRKTKAAKKHKTPILKTSSNVTLKTKSCNSSIHKNRLNEDENINMTKSFEDIEKQHKLQLMELTKKHQDEQNRMQQAFENKQKSLLQHFATQLNSSTLDNQNFLFDQTEKCILNSEKPQEPSKFFKTNIMSSTKLYNNNNKSENKNVLKESASNNITNSPDRKEHAAIIINKYVRGYLTRRMFKTHFVQKIVMIIQDTLLFIINFHRHANYSDNLHNIKLKVRLLQQLKSSCYNLHNVFFKFSTKQQMALISKDRLYKIKNKSLQAN